MKRTAIAAAIVLAGAVLPMRAFAREFIFPGTICQPVAASNQNIAYSQFGAVNVGTSAMTVECPMKTIYNVDNFRNSRLTLFNMTVFDHSTTADITCTLRGIGGAGDIITSINFQSTNGSPGGPFQSMNIPIPAGTQFNAYWVARCTVPGQQSGSFSSITSLSMSALAD